jgi:hypothetical protein
VRELLLQLARALAREPERVRVAERAQGGATVLALSVAPADRGRIIGREGRTAAALRTLLAAVARRGGGSCVLEIEE